MQADHTAIKINAVIHSPISVNLVKVHQGRKKHKSWFMSVSGGHEILNTT